MYFVSGITGQVGGAVARKLLADGHDVRALVRNPDKAAEWSGLGVELRAGDANNTDDVASALDGVDGAFLMMFPTHPTQGYPEAQSTVNSYRDALCKAPPPRLVVLSSFGSEQPHGLGNITSTYLLEQALKDVAFPTAFVRAGSFIENYAYGLMQAESSGSFGIFLSPTDRGVPMVASIDIGNEVASLLTTDWTGKRTIELGSRITPDDLALAISEVSGKHVTVYAIPRDQWTRSLVYMGVPAASIPMYEEMMESINSGWIDFGKTGTERVAGVTSAAQVFAAARQQKNQSV